MKNFIKKALKFFAFAFVLLLLTLAGFFWWLTSAPRSLPIISAAIVKTVKDIDPALNVSVESTVVEWSGFAKPLMAKVSKIYIYDGNSEEIAELPEVNLGIDLRQLVFGRFRLGNVEIINPIIRIKPYEQDMPKHELVPVPSPPAVKEGGTDSVDLPETPIVITQQSDKLQNLPPSFQEKMAQAAADFGQRIKSGKSGLPFRKLQIEDAEIYLTNQPEQEVLSVQYASFQFLKNRGRIDFSSKIIAKIGENIMKLDGKSYFNANNGLESAWDFSGLNPRIINEVFIHRSNDAIPDILLKGTASAVFAGDLSLSDITLNISSESSGKISHSKFLPQPINIVSGSLKFSASGNFKKFNIDSLDLMIEDNARIALDNVAGTYPDLEHAEIKGGGRLENITLSTLLKIWPEEKSTANAKTWVKESLSGAGGITMGRIGININPGGLANPVLPEDAIGLEADVRNIDVNYNPKLTPIQIKTGVLKIGGNSLEMKVSEAEVNNSSIKNSRAYIADMMNDNSSIEITGEVSGKAEDLNEFINLKNASDPKAKKIKIGEGTEEAKFKIGFPLLKDIYMKDVKMDIDSKLSGISVPKVEKDIDLTKGDFAAHYDSAKLSLEGKGLLNGAESKIKYAEEYLPEDKYTSRLDVVTTMPKTEIAKFLDDDLEYLSGDALINLTITNNGQQKIDINADLKNMAVDLSRFGYQKAAGEELSVDFNLHGDSAKSSAAFKATGTLKAEGTSEFGENYSLQAADVKSLVTGKDNLEMKYTRLAKDRYRINVNGKTLDAAPIIDGLSKQGSGGGSSFEIIANIKNVLLKNDRKLNNIIGDLDCTPMACYSGKFIADQGEGKKLVFEMTRDGDSQNSHRILKADDAGAVVGGLGISPNMRGGKLDENSTIRRDKNNAINEGKLIITDYSVVKAPVLARIVTLASFTGILDLLNDEGINFQKLSVNFSKDNNVIKITDSKAYGPSLGLTAEGFIDLKKEEVGIEGTIIPSYTLNSLLGNVPVIGQILSGGEGKGLIASTYKVTGNYKNPEVSVNPLALLTPGILRGVFDVFYAPEKHPKVEDNNAPQELKPERPKGDESIDIPAKID